MHGYLNTILRTTVNIVGIYILYARILKYYIINLYQFLLIIFIVLQVYKYVQNIWLDFHATKKKT